MKPFHAFVLSWLAAAAVGGSIRLSAYPLAVRSPWLSAWVKGDAADDMTTAQATFWNGVTLGWEIMARVGDDSYTIFGYPGGLTGATSATQNTINFTSTHTYVSFTAGSAEITLDFFSPVSPNNLLRQSLPYSYLTVTTSASNTPVQIFSAIDDDWTGGGDANTNSMLTSGSAYMYTLNNSQAETYKTVQEIAHWGTVIYATAPSANSKLSYQCGATSGLRSTFTTGKGLSTDVAATCGGSSGNIYAYSHDLGTVNGATSVTFAIGQSRVDAVEFMEQPQSNYYQAQYASIPEAVEAFFNDYEDALAESHTFDAQVLANASAVSTEYADILEASVRQTFGAMEITIPAGNLSTDNPMVFVKEISSDDDIQTVDVLYPTFPIFYLLAPEWIKYMVDPLLVYLQTGAWPQPYMIHDLGHYPTANGHANGKAEFMPIESTAMTMVLIYAYQNRTGDTTWAQQYSTLLKGYADWLVANGAANQAQLATVDAVHKTANETMLAMQAAIGLTAYGAFASDSTYTQKGLALSDMLYTQGAALDSGRTHFVFKYGSSSQDSTWSNMFPLYVDKLLGLNTFPQSASDMMSDWYGKNFATAGLPYMSNVTWAITDWNMWVGAISADTVRDQVITTTHSMLMNPINNKPFQTKYDVMGDTPGKCIQNIARSTVGSNFAYLALQMSLGQLATSSGNSTGSSGTSSSSSSSSSAMPSSTTTVSSTATVSPVQSGATTASASPKATAAAASVLIRQSSWSGIWFAIFAPVVLGISCFVLF